MRITIEVPDQVLEQVKDKLPPEKVLQAIALNAVVDFVLSLQADD